MSAEHDRRSFLKRAALGAAALPILERLGLARQAFAEDVAASLPEHRAAGFANLRQAYGLDPGITYLNHGSIGTTPLLVQQAQRRYLEICERNPWLYMWGGAWEEPREDVRRKAAGHLGCDPAEVAFTHNTTETFNLLAQGLPLEPGDEVLFSSLNHTGASAGWIHHGRRRGYRTRRFDFPVLDTPDLDAREIVEIYGRQIRPETRVLVVPHVDNMVGLRHPVAELARMARSRGVRYVAIDGAQSVGMLPLDIDALGVDVYATSPHKWLQSPKGLGLTYVRRQIQEELQPMWVTWGQERWRGTARAFEDYGTRNLAEVLTLGDALDFQKSLGGSAKEAHYRDLWQHARQRVDESPRFRWRSPKRWELAGSLYAVEVLDGVSREIATRLFEEHGFIVRPFETQGLNTLRLSPNTANSRQDLDRLFELS